MGFYPPVSARILEANGKVEITDGELVQFEPMMKLSKYINVDELRAHSVQNAQK